MSFQPDQSAKVAHAQLQAAVQAMNEAEHCVVLWFADIDRRKLYRALGYSSMWQYATEALKFSRTRAKDFLNLARKLEELPKIRASVASGELGYTKAREIVRVADPATEEDWVDVANSMSRRDLERKVARVKKKARQPRNAAQVELLPPAGAERDEARLTEAVPVRMGVTMTPEQAARYNALWQQLDVAPNADDLLEALAALVEERQAAKTSATRVPRGTLKESRPPVQIHVHQCPDCGAMEINGRPLDRADRERVLCDAAIATPGLRNTTTIPPRTRREVLARDRHRCQAPGCIHTRFLEIHHITPRSRGGSNDPANLTTLCGACHRLWHERRAMDAAG